MTEDYWAQLRREDGTSHGATQNSPTFQTEADLMAWVRSFRQDGDEVAPFRREISGNTFKDRPLTIDDEPDADPERLKAMLAGLAETLSLKAAEHGMPQPRRRLREQAEANREPARAVDWKQHRAKLEAAGAALRARETEES